jgi:hypothetical protein
MQTKLFKVLFILHFLFSSANAEGAQYDNSQLTDDLPSKQNVSTKVKAREIVEVAQSATFMLSCLLAIVIFVLLLSCCFCPVVLVNMLSCILKAVIQFCTYILEKFVHLITVFINMLCTIYSERQFKPNKAVK